MTVVLREATGVDIAAMTAFIFEHGANEWNFLPVEDVTLHLAAIADGKTRAVIAETGGALVGFMTFMASRSLSRYQSIEHLGNPHGYICEAVVHREHAGRGIGTRLIAAAVDRLRAQGFVEIFIDRHEENPGSAGMMRKAGFVEIDTYHDPARRASGSRRTTVCRLSIR